MKVSQTQKKLVTTLSLCGMEKEGIIAILLMLQKSKKAMTELGMYIADNYPIEEEKIMEKAVELYQNLPKELQTGE